MLTGDIGSKEIGAGVDEAGDQAGNVADDVADDDDADGVEGDARADDGIVTGDQPGVLASDTAAVDAPVDLDPVDEDPVDLTEPTDATDLTVSDSDDVEAGDQEENSEASTAPYVDGRDPDRTTISAVRVIAVVVFVGLAWYIIWTFSGPPLDRSAAVRSATTTTVPSGPMRVFGANKEAPVPKVREGEVMSASLGTFYNSGTGAVTVTGWKPLSPVDVDVEGVKFISDGPGFAPYMGKPGFPNTDAVKPGGKVLELAAINPITPQGGLLQSKPPDDTVMWAIVGLRLQPGKQVGSLAGVALTYEDATGPHQLVINVPLVLCTTDQCP